MRTSTKLLRILWKHVIPKRQLNHITVKSIHVSGIVSSLHGDEPAVSAIPAHVPAAPATGLPSPAPSVDATLGDHGRGRDPRPHEPPSSTELLDLLQDYHQAEKHLRTRTRESMRLGETDLLALRFLVEERSAGRVPRQRDLACALELTPAATSVLLDRLSISGYVQRVPHPEDRRSVALEVLGATHPEVDATFGVANERITAETEALTPDERAVAAKFMRGLITGVTNA